MAQRRVAVAVVAIAASVAAYIGFQMPISWAMTLQSISLFDGFHRRFLVGTVLYPALRATHYDARVLAVFSFAVLGALLAIICRLAITTPLWSRRLLIVAFLLLPTGGFLFHEVGYFEQVVYLMLFGSMYLVTRGNVRAAAVLMAFAPCVHELAVLTVVPVFGIYVLRRMPLLRAALLVAPAVAVGAVVLLVPTMSAHAVENIEASLAQANFKFRVDAMYIFIRSQHESWAMYSILAQVKAVVGTAVVVLLGYLALWRSVRFAKAGVFLLSCLAIVAPFLLVFGGWDDNRWIFLITANFFIVLWISLDDLAAELAAVPVAILAVTALVLGSMPIYYFEHVKPRRLNPPELRAFLHNVTFGRIFRIPDE